jgi:hypothetical protein
MTATSIAGWRRSKDVSRETGKFGSKLVSRETMELPFDAQQIVNHVP